MKELIDWLEGLANKTIKPYNASEGLCYNLDVFIRRQGYGGNNVTYYQLKLMTSYESWSSFSGYKGMPVPHPKLNACDAFMIPYKWRDDEYGDKRRDLCGHFAKYLRGVLRYE